MQKGDDDVRLVSIRSLVRGSGENNCFGVCLRGRVLESQVRVT